MTGIVMTWPDSGTWSVGKCSVPKAFVKNNKQQVFNISAAWSYNASWVKQAWPETLEENLGNKICLGGFEKL